MTRALLYLNYCVCLWQRSLFCKGITSLDPETSTNSHWSLVSSWDKDLYVQWAQKKIMKKEYTYILHWHKLVQSIRIQSCVTSYHFRTAQLFVNYFTIKYWEVDWVMAISHRRQTAMQALELLWIAWQLSGHPLQFDITPIFHIPNQTLSLSFSQWPQPCCPTFFFFF